MVWGIFTKYVISDKLYVDRFHNCLPLPFTPETRGKKCSLLLVEVVVPDGPKVEGLDPSSDAGVVLQARSVSRAAIREIVSFNIC